MAEMNTSFMGIEISNPFIVGASTLTSDMNTLKNIEKRGAGAVVIRSLFEEQIEQDTARLESELTKYDDLYAEQADMMPTLVHGGPAAHLYWVKRAVKEIGIPVIASLNAVHPATWIEYSKALSDTDVAGIELNMYSTPTDPSLGGARIESSQIKLLKDIRKEISIPISVKLSYFYTNPLNYIKKADPSVDGFVLFNRFMQPTINTMTMETEYGNIHSDPMDNRIPLRYTGLLYGKIGSDICASGGIHSGEDAAKIILAGASAVQTVSALYAKGIGHLETMKRDLNDWMDAKGFARISDIKGKLSAKNLADPDAYSRSQYIKMLTIPKRDQM